jgi:phospholipid transport system transporter-binding protein
MISCAEGRCTVQGPITMKNVTALLADSERAFTGPHVVVDMAGVTEVDSTAVSLLLEWQRAAQAGTRRVQIVNMPANLKSLADLYGVSDLLSAS